jgi:hypothetical protein
LGEAKDFHHGAIGESRERRGARDDLSDDVNELDLLLSQVALFGVVVVSLEASTAILESVETLLELFRADALIVPKLHLEPDLTNAIVVEAGESFNRLGLA